MDGFHALLDESGTVSPFTGCHFFVIALVGVGCAPNPERLNTTCGKLCIPAISTTCSGRCSERIKNRDKPLSLDPDFSPSRRILLSNLGGLPYLSYHPLEQHFSRFFTSSPKALQIQESLNGRYNLGAFDLLRPVKHALIIGLQ